MNGSVPLAATVKVALSPSHTVCEAGGVVTAGGTVTVRVAVALVRLPQRFETTTS